MACNSTGGGGGAANMAAETQTNVIIPQNSEWGYGDNDGYANLGHANTTAGKASMDAKMGWKNGGVTDQWLADTTAAEKKGVKHYTGMNYHSMNSHLRNGTSISSADAEAITQTTDALKKGVLDKPTIFHRGSTADLLGGASTVSEIQAMIGQIVSDKGFGSSSASTSGAFGGKIAYHIKTPAGKGIGAYVRSISTYPGEMEFLFQRSSAFRVVGAYEKGGKVHCNLEYVGNGIE